MQVPILSGMVAGSVAADFRASYPRNLVPVPMQQGISAGYLRPAEGVIAFSSHGYGLDRGGIVWRGQCYRVAGTKLLRIGADGAAFVVGDVGGIGPVGMDYSFDHLGIVSDGALYLATESSVARVIDSDIGRVTDACFIGGYWMFTDGEFVGVTELTNPFSVNPLKYGSSEVDPDSVVALRRHGDEVFVLNRHTVETARNVGGDLFPFATVPGSQLMKGCIGPRAACMFTTGTGQALAFLGSGRNEPPSVYIGNGGQVAAISTREIDRVLEGYGEGQLSASVLEARTSRAHSLLYVHLHDRTLVYDAAASAALQEPVWYILDSGVLEHEQYRARGFVWCYDRWIAGDPRAPRAGVMSDTVSSHYGQTVAWEFGTIIVYAEGQMAMIHDLELVALTGRAEFGKDPTISASYSTDGVTYSTERHIKAGRAGERDKRLFWMQQGPINHWRIQRFRGTSDAPLAFARLEARIERLGNKRAAHA